MTLGSLWVPRSIAYGADAPLPDVSFVGSAACLPALVANCCALLRQKGTGRGLPAVCLSLAPECLSEGLDGLLPCLVPCCHALWAAPQTLICDCGSAVRYAQAYIARAVVQSCLAITRKKDVGRLLLDTPLVPATSLLPRFSLVLAHGYDG